MNPFLWNGATARDSMSILNRIYPATRGQLLRTPLDTADRGPAFDLAFST
jgi:hypothetical protein